MSFGCVCCVISPLLFRDRSGRKVHRLVPVSSPSHAGQAVVPSLMHCFQHAVWKVCRHLVRITSSPPLKSSQQCWHVLSLLVCSLGSWYVALSSDDLVVLT